MKTFAVAILAATLTAVTIGINAQLGAKSSSEVVKEYETVHPQVLRKTRATRNAHSENIDISIRSESGEAFTLQLTLNDKLIAPQFSSIYFDEDGTRREVTGQVNCFYHGQVLEHPEWMVAMDTCQGLRGSFGDWSNKTQHYNVEPLNLYNDSLEQPHALFLAANSGSEVGDCGTEEQNSIPLVADEEELDRARRQTPDTPYTVELYVVNDNARYRRYGGNIIRIVNSALAIVNMADMIFYPENISIVATHMETWSNGDRSPVLSTDKGLTLTLFVNFIESVQQNFDASILLTAVYFPGISGAALYAGVLSWHMN